MLHLGTGLAVFGLWLGFIILKVFFNVNDSVNPLCCFMRTHRRKHKVMYGYVNVGTDQEINAVCRSGW